MKQVLLILAVVALVGGCASTSTSWVSDPSDPNSVKIEAAIRESLGWPVGEITKEDLEQFKGLRLDDDQLTSVKGLKKLTQLTYLSLAGNPALTKAQIDQLQKALPKCRIIRNKLPAPIPPRESL